MVMDTKTRYKVRRVVSRGTPGYQLGHYEMAGKPGARHVTARFEALRRAGYELEAVSIVRELPAPSEPTDDAQVEWAMIDRPYDYWMDERLADGEYAEREIGYPMGPAVCTT